MTTIFAPIAVAPNPNFKERLRATASEAGNITDKCHGNEIPSERVKATSRTSETNAIDRVDVCSQGDDFSTIFSQA